MPNSNIWAADDFIIHLFGMFNILGPHYTHHCVFYSMCSFNYIFILFIFWCMKTEKLLKTPHKLLSFSFSCYLTCILHIHICAILKVQLLSQLSMSFYLYFGFLHLHLIKKLFYIHPFYSLFRSTLTSVDCQTREEELSKPAGEFFHSGSLSWKVQSGFSGQKGMIRLKPKHAVAVRGGKGVGQSSQSELLRQKQGSQ